ncbi:hypothetical protein B0T17DRAFT_577526 [Bombardia bombarda]|uniref:Uncharacterized protein n=1 Tax=Bombardia bombarda TaxID=252184 RepID=A0AA40C4A1_9PEZI|nr:hypothetical protein B0T17DRAFT_577526 [Bombardia bombarda]
MDIAQDPCWSWPHWKFGLKRDDLFSTLHDQYNTFPSTIQDPEAFHHDVYEISHEASTTKEFHHLLEGRKQQRLRELNESLESAAFEIIASPDLIGTEQWHHALQLFRTKSLDSLVRYFASYLPEDHPWHKGSSVRSTSVSDRGSSVHSLAHSQDSSFFGDDDYYDEPIMTDEPLDEMEYHHHHHHSHLPPSPRSMTMCSDASSLSTAASPMEVSHHHKYDLNMLTPARTLSISESEPDCFAVHNDLEDVSQPNEPQSPATSVSDMSEEKEKEQEKEQTHAESITTTITPTEEVPVIDVAESETPTPKPERQSTAFFDMKPSLPHRRYRSLSPSRPHPLSQQDTVGCAPVIDHNDNDDRDSRRRAPLKYVESLQELRLRRRECSPMQRRRGRCPGQEATRVQKAVPESIRLWPRGRRRA